MSTIFRLVRPNSAEFTQIAVTEWSLAAVTTTPTHPIGTALLIPGFSGSKEDFAPIMDQLTTAGYRVIAIDLPGQFQSPGPADPAIYTVNWLGSMVCATATSICTRYGEPLHLVGHSLGGLVARAAVINEPKRFATLTLLGSGPAQLPTGPRTQLMETIEPLMPRGLEFVYAAMTQIQTSNPPKAPATLEAAEFMRQRFISNSSAGLVGMAAAVRSEPDRVVELRAIDLPILVMHGAEDDAWSPSTQTEMAHRLGAAHIVIENAAHSPAIENPAKTATELLTFWESQRVE